EIENFLLVPRVLERAAEIRIKDKNQRMGGSQRIKDGMEDTLERLTNEMQQDIQARFLGFRIKQEKARNRSIDEITLSRDALTEFHSRWKVLDDRLIMIPGKELLAALNNFLSTVYG